MTTPALYITPYSNCEFSDQTQPYIVSGAVAMYAFNFTTSISSMFEFEVGTGQQQQEQFLGNTSIALLAESVQLIVLYNTYTWILLYSNFKVCSRERSSSCSSMIRGGSTAATGPILIKLNLSVLARGVYTRFYIWIWYAQYIPYKAPGRLSRPETERSKQTCQDRQRTRWTINKD